MTEKLKYRGREWEWDAKDMEDAVDKQASVNWWGACKNPLVCHQPCDGTYCEVPIRPGPQPPVHEHYPPEPEPWAKKINQLEEDVRMLKSALGSHLNDNDHENETDARLDALEIRSRQDVEDKASDESQTQRGCKFCQEFTHPGCDLSGGCGEGSHGGSYEPTLSKDIQDADAEEQRESRKEMRALVIETLMKMASSYGSDSDVTLRAIEQLRLMGELDR